jgi:lysozyme
MQADGDGRMRAATLAKIEIDCVFHDPRFSSRSRLASLISSPPYLRRQGQNDCSVTQGGKIRTASLLQANSEAAGSPVEFIHYFRASQEEEGSMLTGLNAVIDLSHHNGTVDFEKIRDAGILGVIHKATQGTANVDPLYKSRRQKALDAGLLWGAYHFGTGSDGVMQADHFLDVAAPDATTLLVLDFEANPQGPSMSLEEARAFVTHVQAVTGTFPGFYSGHYVKDLLGSGTDPVLANCWFWLSQYGPTPVVPANWSRLTLWQYTDGAAGPEPHEVDGVGHCDRDTFQGAEAELRALWHS